MTRIFSKPGFGRRYLFAPLIVSLITLLKLALMRPLGTGSPFILYFSGVILSVWYGGIGPGVLCALLSGLMANFFFLPPALNFSVGAEDLTKTFVFILEALLVGAMNRSRVQAKRTAEDQRGLIEKMLSSVGDGVFTTNVRGQIETMNPSAEILTGWMAKDAVGRVCGSVVRLTAQVHPVSEALESGLPYRSPKVLELLRRNGPSAFVEVSVVPLTETSGAVTGCLVILRDRTAQVASQLELESALTQTSAILESISNAFLHLDAGWRFTYVNREAERVLRRTRETLLGKTIWQELGPELGPVWDQECRRAATERSAARFEAFYAPLNAWFEVHIFPSPGDAEGGLSVYFDDITIRKQLEAERQSLFDKVDNERRLLDEILNGLPAGVLILDSAGSIVLANQQVETTLGLPRVSPALNSGKSSEGQDLEHAKFRGYGAIHPHTGEPLQLEEYPVMRALHEGVTILNREISIRAEGRERLVEISATPLRNNAAAGFSGAVLVVQDVTERKRTKTALEQARRDTARVLESINEGVIELDKELRFLYLNTEAARTLGVEVGSVVGKQLFELFPDAKVSESFRQLFEVLETGKPAQYETFYAPWNQWFQCKVYPTDHGGLICFFTDITEQVRSRRALERSERRYRSLVMATAQIVWNAAAGGNFTQPQPSWAEFTGQPWPEHAGEGAAEMIHVEDRQRVREEWAMGLSAGTSFQVAYRLWHAGSGEYRECVSRGVPLRDENGVVQEWIGTITDVHDRKRLEEKLLQTAKLESLGVLAGGIAHDFNNLLTGILGSGTYLLEELPRNDRLYPLVKTLCSAAERAAQLTRQMLAYSGRGRFLLEVMDISTQVKQIGELLRASIPRNVDILWNLHKDPIPVQVDPAQLQQLVMNLVINGAEAIEDQPGHVTVSTTLTEVLTARETLIGDLAPGEYALLEIADTGCGMDEHTRHRIFDPFFTTKFTGRGLGLAAVLGIVRAHKGGIQVETAKGIGTTFRVYLPVARAKLPDSVAEPDARAALNAAANVAACILLVDDEDVIVETATRLLEPLQWKVLTASNGVQALEILKTHPGEIDLMLLDLAMPVMGGVETAKRVRELDAQLPIIVMSGYDEQETLRQFPHPVDGFLQKPFAAKELEGIITMVAELVRSGQRAAAKQGGH